MSSTRCVVIVAILAMMCGCAAKPLMIKDSSRFAAEGTAFDGQATVYVMRNLSGVGIKWPVNVRFDGVQEGTLFRASYTRFAVPPGRHIIVAHWNHLLLIAYPDVAVSVDFEAGKTYYFAIGSSAGISFTGVVYGSDLGALPPGKGAELVREYSDRTPASK